MNRMLGGKTLLMWLAGWLLAGSAVAGPIYDYQGQNFAYVNKPGLVTTSDSLSGWVEFATTPTANATVNQYSDVLAYEMTDGNRTFSSATGEDIYWQMFFTFDSNLDIVDWLFALVPDGETNNANMMQTKTQFDVSRIQAGGVYQASSIQYQPTLV